MPSKIICSPGFGPDDDAWNLDGRYGFKREAYRKKPAEEMAWMDDLIEDADIKLGDTIEVLYKYPKNENKEPEWVEVGEFGGVDNGALLTWEAHYAKANETFKGMLRVRILGVRKAQR